MVIVYQTIVRLLQALAAVFALAPAAGPAATPTAAAPGGSTTPAQQAALDRMNAYRGLAGVAPLTINAALTRAAANHALYYMLNAPDPALQGMGLHDEQPGRPGFTGADMETRITAAGYGGRWNESMALLGDPVAAVDAFMATVNHRLPILDPGFTETGYGGGRAGRLVVDVFTYGGPYRMPDGGPEFVAWPPDGSTGQPTVYDGNEAPDAFPGSAYPIGTAITLKYTGAGSFALTEAHLADAAGQALPVLTRANYNYATQSVAVVAADRPLAATTRYAVSLTGTIDGQPWRRTWSFTTGAAADSVPLPPPGSP